MAVLYKPGNLGRKAHDVLSGCMARARFAVREAADYDVVVVHREAVLLGFDWIERFLSRRVPTVYDFDDAVWLSNVSGANRWVEFLKGFAKIDRILGMTSAVSAGCEYLAAHARSFNRNVFVVPTSIDLAQYGAPREHVASDVLTVGWTGSVTTVRFFALATSALRRLAASGFPFRLHLIGAHIDIPGVDIVCEDWTPEREIPCIRTFDVGLKPSSTDEWSRGKCPMKDIQYMALGVPPVATRFGTAVESIEDGVSGFLCESDDDWIAALQRLRDVNVRTRIGKAARRVVEERYSAVVAAAAFERTLEAAASAFQSSGASRLRRRAWTST